MKPELSNKTNADPDFVWLSQFYSGATQSNLAAKQAIRKIKLCLFPPSSFLKSWLWGWKLFSADGSMAGLFDSAAAACQQGKTFVRPFFE